jgi:small neutral amino acid transporter SnatA (MarC family)
MALDQIGNAAGDGVAFIVAGGIVYEIIAANCSSPQTTEINASTRAETLMKWVYLGMAQGAVFVAVAVAFQPKQTKAFVLGGGLAAAIMWASYHHAKISGLANPGPSTES